MAYRQPFRSGLKDLAQGLLQQAQAQQQQSQMELQAKQQMSAQQAQAQAQAGQMMGGAVSQAAGALGQGFENRRAEQVRLSEQALADGRKQLDRLLAEQAELRALRKSGVAIENYDQLDNGMTEYIRALSGALSGDVADIFKRLGELPAVEVAPGVMGSDILTAAGSALREGRYMREVLDVEQGQFRLQLDNILQQLWTMDPANSVSVSQAMRAAATIDSLMKSNPDALPRGTNVDFLRQQMAIVQAAFENDEGAQRIYGRAQQLFDSEQRFNIAQNEEQVLGFFENWLNTGMFPAEFRTELETLYNTKPQRDDSGKAMTFDEATAYHREASEKLVVTQRDLAQLAVDASALDLELGTRWKQFDVEMSRREDAQRMIDSLVATGNVSGLLALSQNPEFVAKFPELAESVIPEMVAKARGIDGLNRLSNQFAVMELEAAIETFPQEAEAERVARGSAALMAQASVLGEAGLKNWWSTLAPEMKRYYGGDATFNAAVRDAQFIDLQRGNELINVALARVFPLLSMRGTPENMDAALTTIISTVTEITGDEQFANQIANAAQLAWGEVDEERRNTMLKNTQLDLQNQVLGMDLDAAAFALANPGQGAVDVNQFRQLLDTRRLNASSEHDALMATMRGKGCILEVFTDYTGLPSERGGQNAGSPECLQLFEEAEYVRERMFEIDSSIGTLWNVALGLPVDQRPMEMDNASQRFWVNAAAGQFAKSYPDGNIPMSDLNTYVDEILEAYNMSEAARFRLRNTLKAEIMAAVMTGNFVTYEGGGVR
jgi:hypothetical protein